MSKVPPSLGLYLTELPRALGELAGVRCHAAVAGGAAGRRRSRGPRASGTAGRRSSRRACCGDSSGLGATPLTAGVSGATSDPRSRVIDGLERVGRGAGRAPGSSDQRHRLESGRHLRARSGTQGSGIGTSSRSRWARPFAMDDPKQSNAYVAVRELRAPPRGATPAPARRRARTDARADQFDLLTLRRHRRLGDLPQLSMRLVPRTSLIRGSHCGLGHHPAALFAIADRLRQSADAWRPFSAPRPACATSSRLAPRRSAQAA